MFGGWHSTKGMSKQQDAAKLSVLHNTGAGLSLKICVATFGILLPGGFDSTVSNNGIVPIIITWLHEDVGPFSRYRYQYLGVICYI